MAVNLFSKSVWEPLSASPLVTVLSSTSGEGDAKIRYVGDIWKLTKHPKSGSQGSAMAGGRRFASLAIVGILLVTGGVSGLKKLKTQDLFDEAYRPQDSRKFNLGASESFLAEPSKTFDLSYADGTELQGFTGNDIVHVRDRTLMLPPVSSSQHLYAIPLPARMERIRRHSAPIWHRQPV